MPLRFSNFTSKVWWIPVLRGVIAVLFGILLLVWPAATVFVLAIAFGIFAIADGIVVIISAIAGGKAPSRGWRITNGILNIIIGVMILLWPAATILVALIFVAVWALISGIMAITDGITLHSVTDSGWGWYIAWGVISVLFGILLVISPGIAAVTLIYLVAFYAVMAGALLIAAGFGIRSFAKKLNVGDNIDAA